MADAGLERLRAVARALLWGAGGCLLLPALAWLGTALYEALTPPNELRRPGLFTAMLAVYLVPVGLTLLALGLAAGGWAWWLRGQADREQHRP